MLAPAPDSYGAAVVQVYAARTWGLKKALALHTWIDVSSGGDGWQFSVAGMASIAVGLVVGLEFNLLGLNLELELDLDRPAIELPAYGRIGASHVTSVSAAN